MYCLALGAWSGLLQGKVNNHVWESNNICIVLPLGHGQVYYRDKGLLATAATIGAAP